MPSAAITETERSREGQKGRAAAHVDLEFCVLYAEFYDALALVETTAPVTYTTSAGSANRKNITWRNLGAPDLWLFTVHYGSYASAGKLTPDQFSFRVMTLAAHATQAIEEQQRWLPTDTAPSGTDLTVDGVVDTDVAPDGYIPSAPDVGKQIVIYDGTDWEPGVYTITGATGVWSLDRSPAAVSTAGGKWFMQGTAPDMKGAIGVSMDAVQGCDIRVPSTEFTYTQAYTAGIGDADLRSFRALAGKLNNRPYRGYATGELMYLGCEPVSPEGTLPNGTTFCHWALAHNFLYEPHQTAVVIGDFTLPVVPAHSYVWARYEAALAAVAAGGNVLARRPAALYIDRVARYTDFSTLGITL